MVSIGGYIPLSLIDFPDKLCSIVFFDGCNFHCPFCQNPDLVHPVPTSTVVKPEEVLSHLEKRKKFLDGVVLTGGEPCIQKDLVAFMKKIKEHNMLLLKALASVGHQKHNLAQECLNEASSCGLDVVKDNNQFYAKEIYKTYNKYYAAFKKIKYSCCIAK